MTLTTTMVLDTKGSTVATFDVEYQGVNVVSSDAPGKASISGTMQCVSLLGFSRTRPMIPATEASIEPYGSPTTEPL